MRTDDMSGQTWLAAILIVVAGGLQYGLMVYAIRDLRRRPRVRGSNKVLWALVVLCVPFAGALVYAVYGPTSFRDRPLPPPADPARRLGLPSPLSWLPDDRGANQDGTARSSSAERRRGPRQGTIDAPDSRRAA